MMLKQNKESKEKLLCRFQSAISSRDMTDVSTLENEVKVQVPRDFEGNLQSWSGVFTKVRYVYEKREKPVTMMFFDEIEQTESNGKNNYVSDKVINLSSDRLLTYRPIG